DLRNQIAMVSQDVVLFNDTIAANVAYGQAPERDRVEAALRAANLWETVTAMPDGIDTLVGDNGMRLSGGQRQRLAIARAIYKDAPILILDEATSALDSESERHVQAALETLMKGRTTLVIAHRLSTIERADRILVLEGGKIVESGSHRELLEQGGLYAHLHRIQFQQAAG
ncbi:ATP-binding cassette domain-containing protein, partial [Burkholderia sp. 4812]|nr:ATP-binding cassette domain-containing protein [Burkholderia sp. 4812]